MVIATLKEIKDQENRVGLTPRGVKELVSFKHRVVVQKDAGKEAGFPDAEYVAAGAEIMETPEEIVKEADIVVKVKEPLPEEYPLLEIMKGKTLFTYLHLSACDKALTQALVDNEIIAVAYETVEDEKGKLPLLAPMSEIAGVLSIQYGAQYLQKKHHGRGVTLGRISRAKRARVVVVGGGFVGATAAKTAAGMGAKVTLFDKNPKVIARLKKEFREYLGEYLYYHNIKLYSSDYSFFSRAIEHCDLLVGAVLVAGAKAPQVVTENHVLAMQKGAVIVDVAIDQGGCVWGSKPTSHSEPIYEVDGKIFCCICNMPGQVARQSTQALTSATLPYLLHMANEGVIASLQANERFAQGLNTYKGHITYESVAKDLEMMQDYKAADSLL